jgi:hypothetical protein
MNGELESLLVKLEAEAPAKLQPTTRLVASQCRDLLAHLAAGAGLEGATLELVACLRGVLQHGAALVDLMPLDELRQAAGNPGLAPEFRAFAAARLNTLEALERMKAAKAPPAAAAQAAEAGPDGEA